MIEFQLEPAWSNAVLRSACSLLAALPLLAMQAVYLGDLDSWLTALFGYDAIYLVVGCVAVGWAVFAALEWSFRRTVCETKGVWFALAGIPCLLGFFLPASLCMPVLERMPAYCLISQDVVWEAGPLQDSSQDRQLFTLRLESGDKPYPQFARGNLTWLDGYQARILQLEFQPLVDPDAYPGSSKALTIDLLRQHLAGDILAEREQDAIASDIWLLLQRVEAGQPVACQLGEVGPVISQIDNHWNYYLGGLVWMVGVLVLFLVVGYYTVKRTTQMDARFDHE
ncbi:hypothetical protein [Lignipirellula cremea]|uniref:Uncharacterized protein n=1 Tax=Lignipirellula cremea TaxID=2528010 RepID=A0A518DRE2_9BACT|nr:hypothetical protein [Lignipirellula cremea]QDU94393.1 hypothetical protein Pla8534_21830 [Lignipirellula cremea]